MSRVVYGWGRFAELADEADLLGARRVMLIVTKSAADHGAATAIKLGPRWALTFDDVRVHVPSTLAAAAAVAASSAAADLLVSIGGGSATGLAKAVAARTGLPIMAVPTTYAGSEMTPLWGETSSGAKRVVRDVSVLPRTVIYDPELSVSLPAQLSAASGMNAVAHCVESIYAPGANSADTAHALSALTALSVSLPRVVVHPDDKRARDDAMYGCHLAGIVLANAGTSLHHKVCHLLGGLYDLPHAELHAAVLPHAVAEVRAVVPDKIREISTVLQNEDSAAALFDLGQELSLTMALEELGMSRSDIPDAAIACVDATHGSELPLTLDSATRLLTGAVLGTEPV
ncbi:maleylacetate reductase [Rhodococcus sp. IEGM 248]|nr:maleylacetate reductase [Rhodococcus sp. IEGM 248]